MRFTQRFNVLLFQSFTHTVFDLISGQSTNFVGPPKKYYYFFFFMLSFLNFDLISGPSLEIINNIKIKKKKIKNNKTNRFFVVFTKNGGGVR